MNSDLIKIRSRRNFLRGTALALASIPLLAPLSPQSAAAQTTATKALDENDPMAKALSYSHDATKVDAAKRTNKNSFCKNCVLFAKGGLKADGKDGEWGACNLFAQGLVNPNGWCMSWAQKPGT